MKNELERLIELAKTWRTFSQGINGWSTAYYESEGLKVRCYFAGSGDHSSVSIDDIDISFFDPIQIGSVEIRQLGDGYLDKIIIEYTKFLNKTKREIKNKTKREEEKEKEKRIEILKKELNKLEKKK